MNQLQFHTEPLLIFNHFGQNFDGSVFLLSASQKMFRLISNTDLNNPWNQDILTVVASIVHPHKYNLSLFTWLWRFIRCLLMYFTGHSIERPPTHRLSPSLFVLLLLCLLLSVSPAEWPSIQEREMSSLWVGVWVQLEKSVNFLRNDIFKGHVTQITRKISSHLHTVLSRHANRLDWVKCDFWCSERGEQNPLHLLYTGDYQRGQLISLNLSN